MFLELENNESTKSSLLQALTINSLQFDSSCYREEEFSTNFCKFPLLKAELKSTLQWKAESALQ